MFHEVKIFDKKGKVKKVFPSKKLSKDYWNTFFEMGKPSKNTALMGNLGPERRRLEPQWLRIHICIYVYIRIYIERERERERPSDSSGINQARCGGTCCVY